MESPWGSPVTWLTFVLRRLGAFTLLTFALAWLAVASLAWQAADTDRLLDREQLLGITWLALVCGWLVARSRWGTYGLLLAVAACMVFIVARAGGLETRLAAATIEFSRFGLARFCGDLSADARPVLETLAELWSGVSAVGGRTVLWLVSRTTNQPVRDPVALNLAWTVGASLNSFWTAWMVRRRTQPVHAVLPSTLANAVLGFWQGTYPALLPAALLALLGLNASLAYARQEALWRDQGVDYSEDVRLDLGASAGTLVALLVLVATLAPSVHWAGIVQRAEGIARQLVAARAAPARVEPAGGNAQPSPLPVTSSPFEPLRVTGLPRRHLIGSGPELSLRVIFTAQLSTDDAGRFASPYWRTLTYDRYIGSGWATSSIESTAYRAGASLREDGEPGTLRVKQHVERVGDEGDLLYAAGYVNGASRPFVVGRRSAEDVFGALLEAMSYDAESFVPVPSEAQLTGAAEIPVWIAERYLALPDDVPPRVLALARRLTAAEPTAYARAQAIERYVRAFPYSLDLPPPPAGRDITDYYLFELQRGYCDYSATAFVVLARAAGLPARLVVGYAPGERDPKNSVITVTAALAHSWSEVYVGAAGWVEFEPTSGYPPPDRLRSPPSPANGAGGAALITIPLDGSTFLWWAVATEVLGAAAATIVAGAPVAAEQWQLRGADANSLATILYRRLRRAAPGLGVSLRESDTPMQVAEAIAAALRQIIPESKAGSALAHVAECYQRARYSRQGVSLAEARSAIAADRVLRADIRRARRRRWKQRVSAALRRCATSGD